MANHYVKYEDFVINTHKCTMGKEADNLFKSFELSKSNAKKYAFNQRKPF
jgi:hypothetical protein